MSEDLVPMTEDGAIVGLEDVDLSEGGAPRITIDHQEALWRDTMSGVAVESFEGVVLGLIKQRVLWPVEMGDEPSPPLCKSVDFSTGRPTEKFPLSESGLAIKITEGVTANCEDCKLKDWDTHPTRQGPWCQEQHVWAVLADLEGDGQEAPALLTFQRSSIKPARQYLASFARKRLPAFTTRTQFELQGQKRGSVKFAVPTISRTEATDPDDFPFYAETYQQIRAYLMAVREDDGPSDKAPAKPKVDRDEDEIPDF